MIKTSRFTLLVSETKKRFFSLIAISLIFIAFLFTKPLITNAATGGRIGGGSFDAPTIPRSRSYGGNESYGGYGGYGHRYRGGGIGFPFLLPIFGFGGGGLFGFLIFTSIIGLIVNSLRNSTNWTDSNNSQLERKIITPRNVSLIQVQLGLLASAKEIQLKLRELAASANTSTNTGLQRVLQESTLALLRKPELWVYSNIETGLVPYSSAESTFNRISITERSKLQAEITTNYSGQIETSLNSNFTAGDSDPTNELIAVTIIVASKKDLKLNQFIDNEQITETLRILGSISSNDIIALEVIWQPEGKGDVLSKEELIIQYPNLKHL